MPRPRGRLAFDGPARRLRWGASAKLAWQRMATIVARRTDARVETTHLLLGLIEAQVGTVPRALAAARVDRRELAARAERALERRG